MRNILITGSAGFIGFHISKLFLEEGFSVTGYDSFSKYYDVNLKKKRHSLLESYSNFKGLNHKLEDDDIFSSVVRDKKIEVIIHLAAQAGVRYSIEAPDTYVKSNLIGTYKVLEACRKNDVKHLMIASTSSSYGANRKMPFQENDKSDHPMSFYAASKKATETMSHSYSHLFKIPVTIFRFFTVYGAWGRPDMALFKFTNSILNNEPIDVYNYGKMKRDFTYIDDIVVAIQKLMECPPIKKINRLKLIDSISPVAPWRIVNIGSSNPVSLLDFIKALEKNLNKKAKKNFLPMQAGDVKETFCDNRLLYELTNFKPSTDINHGVKEFVKWFQEYYKK